MKKTFSYAVAVGVSALAVPSASFAANAWSPLWECQGITVQQNGPASARLGERVTYQVKIQNGGGCDLDGADFNDYIPRESTYHDATPQPTDYPGSEVSAPEYPFPVGKVGWKGIRLPKHEDQFYSVTIQVTAPVGRTLLNSACFENARTGRICSEMETIVKP